MTKTLYRELPESPEAREQEVQKLWEKEKTFRRSLELTRGGEPFVFYEGPPTANGRPGIHHIISRTLKDTFCRYRTMAGRSVTRLAGWDTHGLPVEVEAERELGISGKREIEQLGVEKFTAASRNNIFTYKAEWERLSRRIGFWLDYSRAYITCSAEYIESVWWALAQFHEKGLLYRGHKVVPYCPRCGTGLSSHEVALGYDDVTEPAVYIKFPIREHPGEFLLAWTTTPWTIPGNVALAVGAELGYVRARVGDEVYYLAESVVRPVLGDDFEILQRMPGRELEGVRYSPPFPYLAQAIGDADAWYVTTADFVSADEGTGIVHTAVMYGQDDYELGERIGLPKHHLVDEEGRFNDEVEPWAGLLVKEADPKIIEALRDSGLLYKTESYTHSYPFCWRCDTPLIYYARSSWYLRTTAVKDALLAHNAEVEWHPREIGSGRMGEWLENNVDWALSRERYWGTPLPVWLCDANDEHIEVLASYKELEGRAGPLPGGEDFDPHKPLIDTLEWKCKHCGGTMRRTPEVIDAWFDSGSMPFAQWHYPFENRDVFQGQFPADFIAEGVDQTRGWFYSLLAISTVLFERGPYRHVVVNDLVLDAEGVKMSKSRDNVVDPWNALAEFGADAIRFYFLSVSNPWLPKRYDPEAIAAVKRKFLATFEETYRFFQIYANPEGWTPKRRPPVSERPAMDRWLLSRLDGLSEACASDMTAFDVTRAARRISDFVVADLSNWYVRRSRPRFWGTRAATREMMDAAFSTLWEALVTVCRLSAPMTPFISDWVHRALTGASVHLERFPPGEGRRDLELEEAMDLARRLASLGRAARKSAGIKVRQPLHKLRAVVPDDRADSMSEGVLAIVRDELNVKEVVFIGDQAELVDYRAEPNFEVLGPAFGARARRVAEALRQVDAADLSVWRSRGGELSVEVEGKRLGVPETAVSLVEVAREGLAVQSEHGVVVGLETTVDDELRLEGVARELVNRIQRLRRDAGLDVDDRIRLGIFGSREVASAAEAHRQYIANEVLAVEVEIGARLREGSSYEHTRAVRLDGSEAVVGVQQA